MIHQSFIVWIIIQGISLNHDYDYHLRCLANLEDGIPVFRFLSSCSYPLSLIYMVLPQSGCSFCSLWAPIVARCQRPMLKVVLAASWDVPLHHHCPTHPPGQGDNTLLLWAVWGRISEHFTCLAIPIHFILIEFELHTKHAGVLFCWHWSGFWHWALSHHFQVWFQNLFIFIYWRSNMDDHSFELIIIITCVLLSRTEHDTGFSHLQDVCYWLENIVLVKCFDGLNFVAAGIGLLLLPDTVIEVLWSEQT